MVDRNDRLKPAFKIVSAGFVLLNSPWAAYLQAQSLFWLKLKGQTATFPPNQYLLLEVGARRLHTTANVEPQLFSLGILLAEVALSTPILAFLYDEEKEEACFKLQPSTRKDQKTESMSLDSLLVRVGRFLGPKTKAAVGFCLQQTDEHRHDKWCNLEKKPLIQQQLVREEILREYARWVYEPMEELYQHTWYGAEAEAGFVCL